MSSSVTSVVRSFVIILSALSYAMAQVPLGVQMVPNPVMNSSPAPSPSGSYDPSSTDSPSNPYDSSNAYNPGNPNYQDSPNPYYPSNSDSTWSSSLPAETGTPAYGAPPSQYTPPPVQSSSSYEMPYSSFVGGGYSQMNCGYGYQKGYDGKCSSMNWVSPFPSCSHNQPPVWRIG